MVDCLLDAWAKATLLFCSEAPATCQCQITEALQSRLFVDAVADMLSCIKSLYSQYPAAVLHAFADNSLWVFLLEHQQLLKYTHESLLSQEAPVFRCNRKHLRDYLRQGIPVEFGSKLEGIEKTPAGQLTAKFSDGKSAQGSLVVGADGVNSAGRQMVCFRKLSLRLSPDRARALTSEIHA